VALQGLPRLATLIVAASQALGGFLFQCFLQHQLGAQSYQHPQQIALRFHLATQQLIQLLADLIARWYPFSTHGVWSFLPFRTGELVVHRKCPTRRRILQDQTAITSGRRTLERGILW
jgi:hypothetical protein